MLIANIGQIIFYGLLLILGVFSLLMLYSLLRFGKSKILGLVLSAIYILLMLSLYTAAQNGFNSISFPTI